MLNAFRLRELFEYDPETGAFIRRVTASSRALKGSIAGCVEPGGYYVIRVDGKRYYAHRLAVLYMTGDHPENEVDHIDLNRANNAWSNLRLATRAQNMRNRAPMASSSTGVKGVRLQGKKYQARIKVDGCRIDLGSFSDLESAQLAYATAANDLHGSFARRA